MRILAIAAHFLVVTVMAWGLPRSAVAQEAQSPNQVPSRPKRAATTMAEWTY